MRSCLLCAKSLRKDQSIYCSNKCQARKQYVNYIQKWKNGTVNGSCGINAKNISRHLPRYFREKYGEKCSLCGWSTKNPFTNKVPLEIDHINGDSEDNNEKNLRLICPNCHSLSPNFRNLNKGHGRTWRTQKYKKNIDPKTDC